MANSTPSTTVPDVQTGGQVQYTLDDSSSNLSDNSWYDTSVITVGAMPAGPYGATTAPTKETVRSLLEDFGQLDPDERARLQMQLLLSGYDTRALKDVNLGDTDPKSLEAYKKLLRAAQDLNVPIGQLLPNVTGGSLKDLFGRLAGRGGGGATHTNVVQHISDADLEESLLKGFQAALGHAPTTEQAAAFKAAFRGKETAAQPDTSGGGTFNVTDPGNPATAAKQYAEQQSPQDAESYLKLQAFGSMLQALGVHNG